MVGLVWMPWWGKLAGAGLGGAFGGIPGLVLGIVLGGVFDHRLQAEHFSLRRWPEPQRSLAERQLLIVTFALMGYLARIDRVCRGEDNGTFDRILTELGLQGASRKHALAMFARGRRSMPPIGALTRRLRQQVQDDRLLLERCLSCLAEFAARPTPSPKAQRLLRNLGGRFQLAPARVEHIILSPAYAGPATAPTGDTSTRLRAAYLVLGIQENATDAEIKQAYRRKVARYHPDRVLAEGASEEQVADAARNTRVVRTAYDEIRKLRGGG